MDYFDFNMEIPADGADAMQLNIAGEGGAAQRTPASRLRIRRMTVFSAETAATSPMSSSITSRPTLSSSPPTRSTSTSTATASSPPPATPSTASSHPRPPPDDGSTQTMPVPEPSDVLNVVVHAIYHIPVAQFMPPFETVSAAFDALVGYGASVQQLAAPGSPLYILVLSQAPLRPIDAYALAAHYDLIALATPISAHLLAYTLSSVTDELAARIGPIYLKRLFFLHHGRTEALKALLLRPPQGHEPMRDCDVIQQQRLTRAWALASAHLVWDARPNISINMLQAPLLQLERELSCALCKQALRDRVSVLVREWASIKVTI
ncbi:hypothetical protein EVJ58_g11080 [Rhodofomes roseus]|uniref:Uncharacterized protein n=1 Tax=Rhodofomes roseus TaxID=34475 RepID=A0A4Y9XLY0_9APHY|nr:hypothetical protein EVJ58_g11080 [Rhodofomes roseus]